TDQDIAARMRDRLGPWAEPERGLLRWWVDGPEPGQGVALWVACNARPGQPTPDAHEPCAVWISRPCVALPERCPVEDLGQLDELIARVHAWARSEPPGRPHH
ncbi:MAG TPA: hypothetical protein VF482_20060, partial [Trebonia sp.]